MKFENLTTPIFSNGSVISYATKDGKKFCIKTKKGSFNGIVETLANDYTETVGLMVSGKEYHVLGSTDAIKRTTEKALTSFHNESIKKFL